MTAVTAMEGCYWKKLSVPQREKILELKFLILQMLDVLNLCEIDEDEDDMNWHFFELYEIYEHLIP